MRTAHREAQGGVVALTISALGVVFGDIGTSPLYTLKECLPEARPRAVNAGRPAGLLSLIFWSLMMVVTVQVPDVRHAGRQPRARAASSPCWRWCRSDCGRRTSRAGASLLVIGLARRGPALRRGRDHARHLGALSAIEGSRSSRPALAAVGGSDHLRALVGLFADPAMWHGAASADASGRSCCSGSGRSSRWARGTSARVRDAARALARITPSRFFFEHRLRRWFLLWRGRARGHGRRGALRGHGALRPAGRSASLGMRWCCPRSCSTTSARARCC